MLEQLLSKFKSFIPTIKETETKLQLKKSLSLIERDAMVYAITQKHIATQIYMKYLLELKSKLESQYAKEKGTAHSNKARTIQELAATQNILTLDKNLRIIAQELASCQENNEEYSKIISEKLNIQDLR